MPRDAITTIRNAEARAAAIEAEARKSAGDMVAETEQSCAKYCEKEVAALQAELDEKLDLLRQKSNALIEKSARDSNERADAILDDARIRLRGAVKIILQEIEKKCQ